MALTAAQLAKLATKVTGSREAFAAAFAAAQAGLDVPTDFKAVATSPDDLAAFEQAFGFADSRNFLGLLIVACVDRAIAKPDLPELGPPRANGLPRAPVAAPSRTAQSLQGFVRLVSGMSDAAQAAVEGNRLLRQVCEIIHNNTPRGTGVLIAPHLVLTAWHVVADEFEPAPGGGWQPKAGAASRLAVGFDRVSVIEGSSLDLTPVRVSLAKDWLAAWSPCDAAETQCRFPADGVDLSDKLDFAVLRLAESVGFLRSWRPLKNVRAPAADVDIVVYQYPETLTLQLARGTIDEVMARPRFLHRANTASGSSGGPCLDGQFYLVGLHHAGYDPDTQLPPAQRRNRGIPAPAIVARIATLPDLDPATHPLFRIEDERPGPIVGLKTFQALVLEAAGLRGDPATSPRILRVSGGPHSGKRFCLRLAKQLLAPSQDVVVVLPASSVPPSPEEAALKILEGAGMRTDVARARLPAPAAAATTEPAWLRNQFVPAFGEALRAAAPGRRVWLAIDELEHHALPQGPVRDFLGLVYEQISGMPWLRVLLIGPAGAVPAGAIPFTREYRLTDPTLDEVTECIARHYLVAGRLDDPRVPANVVYAAATEFAGETALIVLIEKLLLKPGVLPPIPSRRTAPV